MRKLKITELNRITPEDFKTAEKIPLIVVLDNVRSLHNVGSVFRTADAFRVEAVYLCGITAVPPQAEIHKTALGAENTVNWQYFENTLDAVAELKQKSYHIAAVEQAENSILLDQLHLKDEKYAIILGNEVHGVNQEVMNQCDSCIEIPQFGTKHSLNVSVTSGILIWEFFKALPFPPSVLPARQQHLCHPDPSPI
ncbi:MAG: RNA methyltransferase [Candidatus Symbiothrix sp.]|jgi:tRNA G18 (ribose-2'-O)-methylase SpoU|nr:RNA methyltransferase [Candidatus Symbiothrix sp.]